MAPNNKDTVSIRDQLHYVPGSPNYSSTRELLAYSYGIVPISNGFIIHEIADNGEFADGFMLRLYFSEREWSQRRPWRRGVLKMEVNDMYCTPRVCHAIMQPLHHDGSIMRHGAVAEEVLTFSPSM